MRRVAGTKVLRSSRVLAAVVITLAAACGWAWGRPTVNARPTSTAVLRVDASRPGYEFAPGAVGLSIDANELETSHLRASDARLVQLMRLLGPSVLRIGGSSVDLSWWTSSDEPAPSWATNTVTPADLIALRGLLSAAGWQVLLGVDLGHFEPARVADEARYAEQILGPSLLGIEIGNEPNDFGDAKINLRPRTYDVAEYLHEAQAYRQALVDAMPTVRVYGPALTLMPEWLSQVGAAASMFAEITQHFYPTSTCPRISPSIGAPQPTVSELLSPVAREREDQALRMLVEVGALAGRPTRIGETGTGACDGNSLASPVYASALWALDWILRAASSGVTGLNFHGHLGVCGAYNQSPICAVSAGAATMGDVIPQPVYYGLLSARQLEGGRFVPTNLISSRPLPDLTTWATVTPHGTIRIAIDNLAIGGKAQHVSIPVSGYTATEESLVGRAAGARSGTTFGGDRVMSDGSWKSRYIRLAHRDHAFHVVVPPTDAVIITLRPDKTNHRPTS